MPEPHPWPQASDSSEKQKGIVRYRDRFDTLFLICLSVGFTFLSVHCLRNWHEETQLSKRGILISAVITDRQKTDCGGITCHLVSYRLSPSVPKVNTQFRRTESVDGFVYNALEDVRFVDVRFLPENPRVSRLEVAGFRSLRHAFAVVFSIVVLAILLWVLALDYFRHR